MQRDGGTHESRFCEDMLSSSQGLQDQRPVHVWPCPNHHSVQAGVVDDILPVTCGLHLSISEV